MFLFKCCRLICFHSTVQECNLGRMVNHRENNLCAESFVDAVTGGESLDTSTMDILQFGGNMPWTTTSERDFLGSLQFSTN